ncbi:MAG: P-II family nitrogen regulator [Acidobacteriales bacterium]|nr:P-II family nitrogen regulator [Terriglobales bacterium]
MKEIKAIVQPFLADHVIAELQAIPGLPGTTVSEVRGFERGRSQSGPQRIAGDLGFAQKTKIELVVPDELVDRVLDVIQKHAHTGNPGDGKIFVYTVDEVVSIRTGERGGKAI